MSAEDPHSAKVEEVTRRMREARDKVWPANKVQLKLRSLGQVTLTPEQMQSLVESGHVTFSQVIPKSDKEAE